MSGQRAGFSLELQAGRGVLRLSPCRIQNNFEVEALHLSLPLPGRLDFSSGVSQFKQHATSLERLRIALSEADLFKVAREALRGTPVFLSALQLREGSVSIFAEWCEADGDRIPFFMRGLFALEGEQDLSISIFEMQMWGQASQSLPQICARMLQAFAEALPSFAGRTGILGCSKMRFSPLEAILSWTLVPLGWKLPSRGDARAVFSECSQGKWTLEWVRDAACDSKSDVLGPCGDLYFACERGREAYLEWETRLSKGEVSEVCEAYRALLSEAPRETQRFLCDRLLMLDVPEVADRAFEGEAALQALLSKARRLWAQGLNAEAQKKYVELAREYQTLGQSEFAAFSNFAAARAVLQSDPQTCRALLEQLISSHESWGSLWGAYFEVSLLLGDVAEASRAFSKVADQLSVLGEAFGIRLGQAALQKRAFSLAEQVFSALAAQFEHSVPAFCGWAEAVEAQDAVRNAEAAARIFDRGIEAFSALPQASVEVAELCCRQGELLRRAGRDAEAISKFQAAAGRDPGQVQAFCALAECAFAQNEKSLGLQYVESALRAMQSEAKTQSRADLNLQLARLLRGVDAQKAVRFYQKALCGTETQVDEALCALKDLHAANAGDFARDLELAIHGAKPGPKKAQWLFALSQILSSTLGDDVRARSILLEARALEPLQFAEALLALDRKLGEAEEAADLCLQLADASVDADCTASFYCERGDWLRKHLDRSDEAAEAYTLALGVQPKWLGALEGLEEIYRSQNRRAELLNVLKKHADLLEEDAAALCFAEAAQIEALQGEEAAARRDVELALAAAGIWGQAADSAMEASRLKDLFEASKLQTPAEFLHALCEGTGWEEARLETYSNVREAASSAPAGDSAFWDFADAPDDDLEGLSAGDAGSLREAAIQAGESEDAADLWLMVAENERDEKGDMDAAEEAWRRALDLASPGSDPWQEALENLEDVCAVREDFDALLLLYDRRRQGGQSESSVELLKASILKAAGRIEEAIVSAKAALPEGDRALDLLVQLLSEAGRNGEAADVMLQDLDDLSKKEAAYRKWKVAGFLEQSDPSRAMQFYFQASQVLSESMLIEDWVNFARQEGSEADLCQALKAQAALDFGNTPTAKAKQSRIALEAARLCSDLTERRSLLNLSLQAWSENVEAMDLQEQTLIALGDNAGLLSLLQLQAQAALPGKFRGKIFKRIASLQLQLGQRDEALKSAKAAAEDCKGTSEEKNVQDLLESILHET